MNVLIVVDMQNDFITGALGTKEAVAIVPAVVKKIREHNGLIAVTQDTHLEDYMSTQEGRNLPVLHCVRDTDGWAIQEEVWNALHEREGNTCVKWFEKPTFGSVALAEWILEYSKVNEITEITLIGLCTDICVISNAMLLKALMPEVLISVDATCCAGVTPESHMNALNAMGICQITIKGE